MRISDWSSDVCSSDLPRLVVEDADPDHVARHLGLGGRERPGENRRHARTHGQDPCRHAHHSLYRFFIERVDPFFGSMVPELRRTRNLGRRVACPARPDRSEEHTSELQSLMRLSFSVFSFTTKTTFYIYL